MLAMGVETIVLEFVPVRLKSPAFELQAHAHKDHKILVYFLDRTEICQEDKRNEGLRTDTF
jgi:hypothetical protein